MKTNALLFSLILISSSLAGCFGDSDESEEQDIDSIIQEIDSDNDGILNSVDLCPDTADDERQMVDSSGCYDEDSFLDSDNDGVANNKDECQDSPETEPVFLNGCSITQLDFDKDGVIDTLDQCPNSPPDIATLSNGCFEGEVPNSVAVRIVSEPIQNYKISKPINSIVFGFNSGQNVDNQTYYGMKYTTNIGPFTADENHQLVIGTIHNDKFQSPEDGHLMIHYTSEQLIENIPEYIATLNDEADGGYGGLYYNSINGDGFTNYTLEHYIWSIPNSVDSSFFDPPANNDLVGTEVCDQPPTDETMFSMPNGEILNLSLYEFAGKVIVLEIGAEWCVPCQQLLQQLKELNSIVSFRNKIQFLSMSMENKDQNGMSIEEARARQISEGINFPVSGTNELGGKYLGDAVPMILILTIDPSRDLGLVTVSKTVGGGIASEGTDSGVGMFDTLVEIDHFFSGEFAAELCNSYVKENPYDYGDDDNDGVLNFEDAFPEDPEEQSDLDGDGIGNNADLDDDGDGVSDVSDLCPHTEMSHYSEIFSILHADGCADIDGDQYNSTVDCNDYDARYTVDSDGDSYCDELDRFPNDNTEWNDSDDDGVGDNSDAFPNDLAWQYDSDDDGVPDPIGFDYDDDGIIDEWSEGDYCPNTPPGINIDEYGCADLDADGWGYNDCDDNNSEIYPGADEIQDSIDNDCDGTIDEVIPPLVVTVEMTPSVVYTDTDIECFANSSAGNWVELYIFVNGLLIIQESNYGVLGSNNFVKGDIITCAVLSFGPELIEVWDRVVVSNSPPELGGVLLDQLNNGTIVCEVWGSSDLDGDDITLSYQWFVDGELSTVTNSYLMSSDYTFSEGDDVTCIVTPHDGEDAGSSASKTITMEIMPEDEEQD